MESAYRPISDYAIIGNCRSVALVSRAGSIDWLCWPRFSSPSVFAALLDARTGGYFSVAPTAPFTTTRRYVGESAILETTFHTDTGVARLVDLMPVTQEGDKASELWPDHELLRRVECVDGTVDLAMVYAPRPDYARRTPHLRREAFGITCAHRNQIFSLTSTRPLQIAPGEPGVVRHRASLAAGESWTLSLTYCEQLPAVTPPIGPEASVRIDRSLRWWTDWMDTCQYEGFAAPLVRRSALTLKLLTYSPSGAVIAAPTASLPEMIGGVRNWDYRYCWLRDSSMTLRALFDLGFSIEGEAFLSWVLHTTGVAGRNQQVMYDEFGEWRLPERLLDHFEGYERSAPVRIGNGASNQLQLDMFGDVIDATHAYVERGGTLDRPTRRMLRRIGHLIVERWKEPDEGIWETRGGRRHHTHSKMMCWVALDRLLALQRAGHMEDVAGSFARTRDEIRSAIEAHGFSERLGSYVSEFDGDGVDASLLLLPIMGFVPARSPRMVSTAARIRAQLDVNGLLYRYLDTDDGLPPGEGAFGICSFWSVHAQALAGELDAAVREFEHLSSFANDVGLYAEEIDPHTGAALGNFPQAFTHIGAINAARAIASVLGEAPPSARVDEPDEVKMGGKV